MKTGENGEWEISKYISPFFAVAIVLFTADSCDNILLRFINWLFLYAEQTCFKAANKRHFLVCAVQILLSILNFPIDFKF